MHISTHNVELLKLVKIKMREVNIFKLIYYLKKTKAMTGKRRSFSQGVVRRKNC